MNPGHLYIIWHKSYAPDTYKCGYWGGTLKGLQTRFNTYNTDPIEVKGFYPVLNKNLAEKLLFYRMHKHRVMQNREFFCCELTKLKEICKEVQAIINKGDQLNISEDENKINSEHINIIQKYIEQTCFIHESTKESQIDLYKFFELWNDTDANIDVNSFNSAIENLGYPLVEINGKSMFKGIEVMIDILGIIVCTRMHRERTELLNKIKELEETNPESECGLQIKEYSLNIQRLKLSNLEKTIIELTEKIENTLKD